MRKNKIKFAAIALLSAFALSACSSDIIAKPTGYDDNSPVVTIEGFSGTVENNKFTDIYDSIRSGSVPSDVLDQLLYQYAMSVFGNYNKVTASKVSNNSFGATTLKEAYKGLTKNGDTYTGTEATNKFIQDHSAYWNKDKNGDRINDTFTTVLGADAAPTQSEYARLNNKWETIEKRIAQKLYSEISGGSYSEENVFEEMKYLRSLSNSIENNVISLTAAEASNPFKGVLTSKVEDYDVFNQTSKDINDQDNYILHRNFYQSNAGKDEEEKTDQDATYVEDKIIPDIYRQLLVEQYLLDESYDTLGRTSARHIDVLSISKNSAYARGANDLMNTFVKDVIFDKDRLETDKINLDTFKMVSNAWIGAFMDNDNIKDYIAADAAGRAAFDKTKVDEDTQKQYNLMESALPAEYLSNEAGKKPYFKGTAYGDMMEEIEKISDNPKLSQNESTYTGSNAYTVEIGKQIKTRELQLKDHTSTGWYIKSVGVSSLPDSLKNQLFDINVSNAVNFNEKCVEYTYDETNQVWKTNENDAGIKPGSLINAVGKVKGQYFLRNTSRIKGNPVESDILFESDNTYYVVLVRDAIRSKSLDKKNYSDNDIDKILEYIDEIVQIVAKNDTYKNLSKKHWLEEMNIKYHDTEVYNYFKTNFPDLFD